VREFEDALAAAGSAKAFLRGILASPSLILTEAQARGLVAQNVVRTRGRRKKSSNSRGN
jgi:hypothetical protein